MINHFDAAEVMTVVDKVFGTFRKSQKIISGEEGEQDKIRLSLDDILLDEAVE